MAAERYNPLTYSRKLQNAGASEEVADEIAQGLNFVIENELATKRDLRELEIYFKRDLKELEIALKRDIKELGLSLIIKLGSLMIVCSGIITGVLGFILKH